MTGLTGFAGLTGFLRVFSQESNGPRGFLWRAGMACRCRQVRIRAPRGFRGRAVPRGARVAPISSSVPAAAPAVGVNPSSSVVHSDCRSLRTPVRSTAFARRGRPVTPVPIDHVEDRHGTVHHPSSRRPAPGRRNRARPAPQRRTSTQSAARASVPTGSPQGLTTRTGPSDFGSVPPTTFGPT